MRHEDSRGSIGYPIVGSNRRTTRIGSVLTDERDDSITPLGYDEAIFYGVRTCSIEEKYFWR